MIVLIRHDADPRAVEDFLDAVRARGLKVVPLEDRRGRAFDVVGPGTDALFEMRDSPAVAGILARRLPPGPGEPLWPHGVLRLAIGALLLLAILVLLSAFFPPGLGDRADLEAPPPPRSSVEWYLRPVAALLDLAPAPFPGILVLALWLAFLLWPFLDRAPAGSARARLVVRVVGAFAAALAALLATGALG